VKYKTKLYSENISVDRDVTQEVSSKKVYNKALRKTENSEFSTFAKIRIIWLPKFFENKMTKMSILAQILIEYLITSLECRALVYNNKVKNSLF